MTLPEAKTSSYRFSSWSTGGDGGRGMRRTSLVACPMYMKNAQKMATFLATHPSTFHILKSIERDVSVAAGCAYEPSRKEENVEDLIA